MSKYFQKIKTWGKMHWPIWVLFLISAIVYNKWLSFGIFFNADYWFSFSETIRNYLNYSAWDSQIGLGASNLFLWTFIFRLATGSFGYFGFDLNVADKFIIFWPFVFLTPLFGYLLAKEILKNKAGAFVSALVFSFSTYYLAINTQGHLPLSLGGTFALLALYFFWRYFETERKKFLIAAALVCLVVGGYDFRVFYILFFILLALPFWLLLTQKWGERKKFFRQNISAMVLFFSLLVLFNLFWLMPTAMTGSLANNEIVARDLVPNNYYLDLGKALTLFHPFWNGSEPKWFDSQDIPGYFWLIPVMVFLGAFWNRKNKKILFWFFIALVAVFLSKQNALPLKSAYIWLHQNFPGFNAFREASKFYFVIALAYAILIGAFVRYVFEHWARKKYLKYGVFLGASLVFVWNVKPILTGEMFEIFTPRSVPADELKLHSFIESQKDSFRILRTQKELVFASYSNLHPLINIASSAPWKIEGVQLESSGIVDENQRLLFQNFSTRLLSESGVRYLVIDKKNDFSLGELLSDPAWKKVDLGLDGGMVYENQKVRPRIYLTDQLDSIHRDLGFQAVDASLKNSARWNFALKNSQEPVWLNFSERFHPDWEVVCGKTSWYALLGKSSIGEHYETDAGLNAYRIDFTEVKEKCGENADGNIALSLYYRPQSYLYLGGTVSLVAIFISLLALVFWKEKGYIKKVEQKEKDAN